MSRSSVRWIRRIAAGIAVLLIAGFAVGSLAGSEQSNTSGGAPGAVYDAARLGNEQAVAPAPASVARSGGGGSSAEASSVGALPLPGVSNSVIKTADLGIEVAKRGVDRAWTRVFQIAAKYGGFVLSSSQGGPGPKVPAESLDDRFADIVIRVPAARFDQTLVDLSNGDLGEVTRRATSGQDVSQEFVDLESRLRNYRAQETVLLRIMARANSIADTIAVQQQLSQVQLQIEEITGRIRYLKNQTELATISVHLAEEGVAGGRSEGPSFTDAWRTAIDGLGRMATAALIAAVWLSPFALLGASWLVARRWRARPAAPQA